MTTTLTPTLIEDLADAYMVDPVALSLYIDNYHLTTEEEVSEYFSNFEDAYVGWFEDGLFSFAEAYLDDTGLVSDWVRPYVDVSRIVRDLKAEGYYSESGHVFRPA